MRWERLRRDHPRRRFNSGRLPVDQWLQTKAWQHQKKHLSATKLLLTVDDEIAGYYTLAIGQVEFSELPPEIAKSLPRRALPVATLAWLGVDRRHQRLGIGRRLLAQALRDCYEAGNTFAFVAVLIDCLDDNAKAFYQRWDFRQLPGRPYRLFLSYRELIALMNDE